MSREALPHPTLADIYTLGHCLTEAYPSDFSGPETVRSLVVVYWGSFQELSRLDPDFGWEEELWETITHELRHHLESLAYQDDLEGVDYALDEGFKRVDGLEWDPWYYQYGDEVADGVFRVESQVFIEQRWTPEALAEAEAVEFPWHGKRYRIPAPDTLGDLHFVWVEGLDTGPATLELVLVRERGWLEGLKDLWRRREPEVLESEATAVPVDGGRDRGG